MMHVAALALAGLFVPVQSLTWHAGVRTYNVVLDRTNVAGTSPVQYQYRLTVYSTGANGKQTIAYRSPGRDTFLSKVVKAQSGGPAFPSQSATIAGVTRAANGRVPVLVVERYEMGADCGSSQVAVFAASGDTVRRVTTIENPCDLSARIVRRGARDDIELTGPYYKANDPLCCPSKPRVRARLVPGRGGRWIVMPPTFRAL